MQLADQSEINYKQLYEEQLALNAAQAILIEAESPTDIEKQYKALLAEKELLLTQVYSLSGEVAQLRKMIFGAKTERLFLHQMLHLPNCNLRWTWMQKQSPIAKSPAQKQ